MYRLSSAPHTLWSGRRKFGASLLSAVTNATWLNMQVTLKLMMSAFMSQKYFVSGAFRPNWAMGGRIAQFWRAIEWSRSRNAKLFALKGAPCHSSPNIRAPRWTRHAGAAGHHRVVPRILEAQDLKDRPRRWAILLGIHGPNAQYSARGTKAAILPVRRNSSGWKTAESPA
jgi:hypothetical protein